MSSPATILQILVTFDSCPAAGRGFAGNTGLLKRPPVSHVEGKSCNSIALRSRVETTSYATSDPQSLLVHLAVIPFIYMNTYFIHSH